MVFARMLTQLNPSIPLMTPNGGGEAIAVIDYGPEHDLMWVVIEDASGEIWTHPNKAVRGFRNYSVGRHSSSPITATPKSTVQDKPVQDATGA